MAATGGGSPCVEAPPAKLARVRRVQVDGKFFSIAGRHFDVRGVGYGTFADRGRALFPQPDVVDSDFASMAAAGVNTVRTYTVPPADVFEVAERHGLKLLVGVWWDDPRTLHPPTPGAWASMARQARSAIAGAAAAWGEHPAVLGFLVGNELPGPMVRWHGRRKVDRLLHSLYAAGKDVAPTALFGYANYPTTEYLDTSCFDFDCFNVFLEDEAAWRRYLSQLQVGSGERPLVIGELGLDSAAHGRRRQAEVLDWQLRAAFEHGVAGTCVFSWTDDWWVAGKRVDDWRFGLTTADREPKPALGAVTARYRGGLLGCRTRWPRVSVVVCAYQEEDRIGQCLTSLGRLRYPDYEVLVVDDGSTDGTVEVARRHPVRLIREGHGGLSVARNLGLRNATGEVVAYIDADAYAHADWLTYLVLGLDGSAVAGVGGPNLVPAGDPPVAQCVGRTPGGPVQVLLDNERAEHVPGCNMAFRRDRLLQVGGFDPIYLTAGDDVDVCWRLHDCDYTVRFHPAAVVWHHPRASVRAFWRQQVGYGRAEALVARGHPDKFDSLGRARWRGVVYGPSGLLPGRSFVYGGRYGDAPYQRLYRQPGGLGVLSGLWAVVGLAGVALVAPWLALLPLAAMLGVVGWCCGTGLRIAGRDGLRPRWRRGGLIGLLHLLQPLARELGRLRDRRLSFPSVPDLRLRFGGLRPAGHGVWVADGVAEAQRSHLLEELRDRLRARRLRAATAPAWGEADLVCRSPVFWQAQLTSYALWDVLYVRTVHRLCRPRLGVVGAITLALLAAWSLTVAAEAAGVLAVAVSAEGWWLRRRVRSALGCAPTTPGPPMPPTVGSVAA